MLTDRQMDIINPFAEIALQSGQKLNAVSSIYIHESDLFPFANDALLHKTIAIQIHLPQNKIFSCCFADCKIYLCQPLGRTNGG